MLDHTSNVVSGTTLAQQEVGEFGSLICVDHYYFHSENLLKESMSVPLCFDSDGVNSKQLPVLIISQLECNACLVLRKCVFHELSC